MSKTNKQRFVQQEELQVTMEWNDNFVAADVGFSSPRIMAWPVHSSLEDYLRVTLDWAALGYESEAAMLQELDFKVTYVRPSGNYPRLKKSGDGEDE